MRIHAFPKNTPPEVIKAIIAGRDPQKEAEERERADKEAKSAKQRQEDVEANKKHLDALHLVAVGIHKLAEKGTDFSSVITEIKALTKAVSDLQSALLKASDAQIKIAKAEVEAVKDDKGRIIGKRLKMDE